MLNERKNSCARCSLTFSNRRCSNRACPRVHGKQSEKNPLYCEDCFEKYGELISVSLPEYDPEDEIVSEPIVRRKAKIFKCLMCPNEFKSCNVSPKFCSEKCYHRSRQKNRTIYPEGYKEIMESADKARKAYSKQMREKASK